MTQLVSEFAAVPLESIISAPLKSAVNAQADAARTTIDIIKGMLEENGSAKTVEFLVEKTGTSGSSTSKMKVPLLTMTHVPHLRIDSVSVHFKYEISSIEKISKAKESNVGGSAGTTGLLSNFVSINLNGNLRSSSSQESTTNRSGVMEISVHASEAPIPEGLAKVLSVMNQLIEGPQK